MPFTRAEVAYAAGLYEGEGHAGATYPPYTRRSGAYVRSITPRYYISFQMTDLEPLERFRDCFGLGRIFGPYQKSGNRKPQWSYRTTKFEEVQAILAAMWPHLSPRRQEQAARCLRGEVGPRSPRSKESLNAVA